MSLICSHFKQTLHAWLEILYVEVISERLNQHSCGVCTINSDLVMLRT